MGEKEQCVVVSHLPPTGDLACKPRTCPDWESNGQHFGSGGSVIPVLRPTHNSHIFCFSTEPVRVPTLSAHSTKVSEHKIAVAMTSTEMWSYPVFVQ